MAADDREPTPIHDSLFPICTPAPSLDFVWGDRVEPFAVVPPGRQLAVGRAAVPVGLTCLVFPPPLCDPALLPKAS